jgi:LysR family transcriptional regulator (chromosome initiation inhibitor)
MSLLSPPLEAFVAIVQTKTVHGAAHAIGLTQTGVTQRIRALESQLSVTLFIRSRRGMMLTPEGEALYRYCQAATDLEGQALSQITGAAKKTSVRVQIIGPTSIMTSRVVPHCAPVMQKFGNLLVGFEVMDEESRVEKLRSGEAQLALISHKSVAKEMESKRLKPEHYVLVCSNKWRTRKLNEILETEKIIDFNSSDDMSFSYLKSFGLLARAKTERHYINNNDALIQLFKSGIGYGVLTREVAEPHLKKGDIALLNSGKVFESLIALAWYPRPQMPVYFQALVDAIV